MGGTDVLFMNMNTNLFPISTKNIAHAQGGRPLPKRMFFTHCVNSPLGFTQSCCGFFDMNIKKCVNVCCDKIQHNSAKICGKNTLNKCVTISAIDINFCVNFRL